MGQINPRGEGDRLSRTCWIGDFHMCPGGARGRGGGGGGEGLLIGDQQQARHNPGVIWLDILHLSYIALERRDFIGWGSDPRSISPHQRLL